MNFVTKNKLILNISRQSAFRSFFKTSVNKSKVATGFNFELSETQRSIRDVVRKFAREKILPFVAHHDKTGEFPWDIVQEFHKLGMMNCIIPEELGGLGLGQLERGIIIEEIGWACCGMGTVLTGSDLGTISLLMAGNDEMKKKYTSRLLEKPCVTAYCITEPGAGSDVSGAKTKAVLNGDDFVINGQKMWITNGGTAEWYHVLARTNPNPKAKASEAFTLFVVEKDTPGLILGPKEIMMGQRASDTRGITFENVRVPRENVIGRVNDGFKIVMNTFNHFRPSVGFLAVGLSQRALDEATKYALERRTMGKPIGEHQAVAMMLAEMAVGVETARLVSYKAGWDLDKGVESPYSSSICKLYGSEVANRIASDAVQIFGGNGFSTQYPLEKLVRDAKILQIYEGTSQIQKIIIAKCLLSQAQ